VILQFRVEGLWLNGYKLPRGFRLHQSDTNRPLAQNLTRPALAVPLKLGLFAGVLQLYRRRIESFADDLVV